MSGHTSRFLSFFSPLSVGKAGVTRAPHVALAGSSTYSFAAPAILGVNKGQKRHFAHGAGTDLTVACRTSTASRPNNGPTASMNLFTAVNSAMHIALETDPT